MKKLQSVFNVEPLFVMLMLQLSSLFPPKKRSSLFPLVSCLIELFCALGS